MPAQPNVPPIDREVTFQDEGFEAKTLMTKTDLKGTITYASKAFRVMSGYSKEELIGQRHSIVRHPDMPAAVFKEMWDTIKANKRWEGYIKNLRKDGKYYWVNIKVEPIYDEEGNKIGYLGVRSEPERDSLEEVKARYKKLLSYEK